jgi:hypothetical protein
LEVRHRNIIGQLSGKKGAGGVLPYLAKRGQLIENYQERGRINTRIFLLQL